MSDTKWREVFEELNCFSFLGSEPSSPDTVHFLSVKILGEDAKAIGNGFRTIARTAVDTECGFLAYRTIEWLEVLFFFDYKPDRTIPARRTVQNVQAIHSAWRKLGEMPLSETQTGLRVTGYLMGVT